MGTAPLGHAAQVAVPVLRQKLRPFKPLTRAQALRELLQDADEGLLSYDYISPVIKPHLGADFRALARRMQAAVQARYGVHPWDEQISACTCSGLKGSEKTSAVRKLSCYAEA